MEINIVKNNDTSYLDHLLENYKLKIMPASFYKEIPQTDLAIWCNKKGIYCLPTIELIDWLKEYIGDNKAIEIGAGTGSIGRALKIPITDSCNMEKPDIKFHYQMLKQPVTVYPNDVKKLDAEKAVKKYNPDIVIGAWITHKYNPYNHELGGNIYGVDEAKLLLSVKKYILIGNKSVHYRKLLLHIPHKELSFDWLFSRSLDSKNNRIFIWDSSEIIKV